MNWTAEEDERLIAAWGRGETAAAITARFHGRSEQNVRDRVTVLRGLGVDLPRRYRRLTAADLEHLAKRRRQGVTRRDIAAELGVSRETVRNRVRDLRRRGVDVDPPPELAPRRGPDRSPRAMNRIA